MNVEIKLIIVYLLIQHYCDCGDTFIPLQHYDNKQGCPVDTSYNVISITKYFEEIDCIDVPKEVLCAFLCQRNEECVSFNQLPNDECHLFRTMPYKIVENSNCKLFQIAIREESSNDVTQTTNLALHCATSQSSTYLVSGKPLYSWLAVDGINGTGAMKMECSHTNNVMGSTSWFMVQLRVMAEVDKVKILVRQTSAQNLLERIRNLTIGVTNQSWPLMQPITNKYHLCGNYTGPLVSADWINIECSIKMPSAKFVVVHPVTSDGNYMCICEIEVFGTNFINY